MPHELQNRIPAVLSGSVGDAPEVIGDTYEIQLPPYGYVWLVFDDPPPNATDGPRA